MQKKFLTAPTGKLTLGLLTAGVAMLVLMLSFTLPAIKTMAGGLDPFDLRPAGYNLDEAVALLEALGEQGRTFYLWRQLPLDAIYPALFGVSFFAAVNWLASKMPKANRLLTPLSYLPLLAAISDYVENILIVTMLRAHPQISDLTVTLASSATVAKSTLTTVFFVAFSIMLLIWGVSKLRSRT